MEFGLGVGPGEPLKVLYRLHGQSSLLGSEGHLFPQQDPGAVEGWCSAGPQLSDPWAVSRPRWQVLTWLLSVAVPRLPRTPRLPADASQPEGSTPWHLTFVLAEIKPIPN